MIISPPVFPRPPWGPRTRSGAAYGRTAVRLALCSDAGKACRYGAIERKAREREKWWCGEPSVVHPRAQGALASDANKRGGGAAGALTRRPCRPHLPCPP